MRLRPTIPKPRQKQRPYSIHRRWRDINDRGRDGIDVFVGPLLFPNDLFSFESKRSVGLKTPHMHSTKDGYVRVEIIIDQNTLFALMSSQCPSNVLNNLSLERNRESEKERIYSWAVEAFTQILPCRNY